MCVVWRREQRQWVISICIWNLTLLPYPMLKGRCAAVRGGNQIYPFANFLREIHFIFKRFRANTESKIPCQRHATQGTEVFFKHSYEITELGLFFFLPLPRFSCDRFFLSFIMIYFYCWFVVYDVNLLSVYFYEIRWLNMFCIIFTFSCKLTNLLIMFLN